MRNFTMAVSRPETPAATEAVHAGLVVRDIRVSYGAVPAVRGVTLDCQPGQIIGVVGPNGAGKTSMLTGIAGIAPMLGGSVSGSVSLDGRDLTRGGYSPRCRCERTSRWAAGGSTRRR
jgi:ABC-type branched-subunit amino acid transport system ATPase component